MLEFGFGTMHDIQSQGASCVELKGLTASPLFKNLEQNNAQCRELHRRCSEWYLQHVETQVREASTKPGSVLLRPQFLPEEATQHLQAISTSLSGADDTSIASLLERLKRQARNDLSTSSEEPREGASQTEQGGETVLEPPHLQYVFFLVGLLSKIYQPSLSPQSNRFEIVLPSPSEGSPRFGNRKDRLIHSLDVNARNASLPFHQLSASFGLRLPSPVPNSTGDTIKASNIYFSNLSQVGKLRIEWVQDMMQHLDLDERNRILRVFAFPSYCALICLSDPQSTSPLSRLLHDDDTESDEEEEGQESYQLFDEICREILVSFGVIFAQDFTCRRAVRSQASTTWLRANREDSIMEELCCERWQQNPLFEYLQSPPTRSNYSARRDFAHLGEKLLHLQEYMNVQSPNDFKTLVFDRRDPLRYWTFVTAIIFGVSTLTITTLALAVSIAQLIKGR